MLALKLLLVPAFLALISLAGRRWGPEVAGWLGGFPVMTGPILFLLTLENGPVFAASATTVALSAVFGAAAFGLTYARVCVHGSPGLSLLCGLASWYAAALMLRWLTLTPFISLGIALLTLGLVPKLFPRIPAPIAATALPKWELPLRMLAGAALTLAVTSLAAAIGPAWSGILAVFPVISVVLGVFSHRASGPAFTVVMFKSMVRGMYVFTSFCFTLALLLPRQSVAVSFASAIAVAAAFVALSALKTRLQRR